MPPRKPNAMAVAAKERKAEHKAQVDAKKAAQQEALQEQEWSKGAKSTVKQDEAARKADEAARRKREKAELLAAEEAELLGGGIKPKQKTPTLSKNKGKSKKKKSDGLSLLEDALVKGAEQKVKAKKRAELAKQQEAERQAKLKAEAAATEQANLDPLLRNTETMLGEGAGRAANQAILDAGASGIDAALGSLSVTGSSTGEQVVVKSQKALHLAFEERMMPIVKAEHPGLRQSQYKEKIFNLWKKSPENPMNQVLEADK